MSQLTRDQSAQRESLIKAKNTEEMIKIFVAMDTALVKTIYNGLPPMTKLQLKPEINHILVNKSVSPQLYHKLSGQDGIRDEIARRVLHFYSKGIFETVSC